MAKRRRPRFKLDIPPRWWLWAALALVPLAVVNLSVSVLGDTRVFILSPLFLKSKVQALGTYLAHRPRCAVVGHPPLQPIIAETERRNRLPAGLLRALIQVESGTQVHRISPAGAMGPGQLMPSTARLLGVSDPFDPASTIDGSARYLAEQLRRFDSIPLAVAAYNAGPGNVRGRRVPRNGETEFYVTRVMAAYSHFKPVVRKLLKRKSGKPARARMAAKR